MERKKKLKGFDMLQIKTIFLEKVVALNSGIQGVLNAQIMSFRMLSTYAMKAR